MNIEDLVLCMLSQHDTKVFARCVQLSSISGGKNDTWSFLSAVKKSGVPLSRSILVKQVQKDVVLLGLINTYAYNVVKLADNDIEEKPTSTSLLMHGFNSCLSLYTAIIMEVIKMKHHLLCFNKLDLACAKYDVFVIKNSLEA